MNNPELEDAVERIKTTVKMKDVVELLGLGPIRHNKIRSIYQPDKTPSLHLYDHDWYDFSTGKGGDQITFVMDVCGYSFGRAVNLLSSGAYVTPARRVKQEPEPEPDLSGRFANEPSGHVDWLTRARQMIESKWPTLTPELVMRSGTKFTKLGMWTPHHSKDWTRITGVKVRSYDGAKRSLPGSKYTESLYRPRYRDTPKAVLVEGESDAWVMAAVMPQDWTILALPSGAATWRPEFVSQIVGKVNHLYLLLDSDAAGERAVDNVMSTTSAPDLSIVVGEPPGGRVAEAVAAGWNPQEDQYIQWVEQQER